MAAIDAAVGGLGGDHELDAALGLGLAEVLVDDVLPAEAVAVLLLDGAGDEDGDVLGQDAQVLHDPGAVDGGDDAALLVGAAPAADVGVVLIALVGVELPVLDVADAHGVDDPVAGSHPAQDVALAVDLHLIKAQLLHLGGDAADDALLAAALAGDGHKIPQEAGHVCPVAFRRLLDRFKIHRCQPPINDNFRSLSLALPGVLSGKPSLIRLS